MGHSYVGSPVRQWIMFTVPFCIDSHGIIKASEFYHITFHNLNILLVFIIFSPAYTRKHQIFLRFIIIIHVYYSNTSYYPPSRIIDVLPLNSLFWSPPTSVHRFDASDMAVPGLYISWPEGSVLGPVLLVLYTNDMPNTINGLLSLSANDTGLFLFNSSLPFQSTMLKKWNELKNASPWFKSNISYFKCISQ